MKLLALVIQGTPVQLPSQINTVNGMAGAYGANLVRLTINLLIFAATLLSLGFILFGGFRWLISDGDKKKVEDARNTIIYAVVGLMIVFLSVLAMNILSTLFNVSLLSL